MLTKGVDPQITISATKSLCLKQYFKEARVSLSETAIRYTRDFCVGRRGPF